MTIVPGFQPFVAAAEISTEDAPVPGGTAAFAQALAIDPVPDRAQFMFEITRLVYENPNSRNPSVAAFLFSLAQPGPRGGHDNPAVTSASDLVPVPLTADIWGRAIFHRKIEREELVGAIVSDHTAALLCHGLGALDDQTLQYFADHSSLLNRLAERSAPAFAAFSGSLHIRANRVEPPGGPDATPLWEGVVGEKVSRPEAFIAKLFEVNEGRLAYLFDTIGQLDPARRAFALGLWMPDPAVRLERFKVLSSAGLNAYRDWHLRTLPFNRASYDLAMTLMRVSVDDKGAPRQPSARSFWARVFGGHELTDDPARLLHGLDEEPIDAAWLAVAVGAGDLRQRLDRLDRLALGQRLFYSPDDRAEALLALRALGRYRMLVLTLERIGVTSPGVYVAAARKAARLSAFEGHRGFLIQAQFQGALTLIARMRAVRTIDVPAAEKLIQQVVSLPLSEDGRYLGAIANWLRETLKMLPAAENLDWTLRAALSGPAAGVSGATRLTWEGQRYRLDLGAAERMRLERVREKQEALPVDVPLDLAHAGRVIGAERASIADAQAVLTRLSTIAKDVPERTKREEEDNVPQGLAVPPEAHAALRRTIDELSKAIRNNDTKRFARIAEPLLELSDQLLSQNLLSIAYALDLGDPDGTILLADDVSHRHDFGFSAKDAEVRARTAWMVPHQDVSPGVPWHVTGSLLGLDIALSPLALRRINVERVLEAPRLTSNQRDGFSFSVAMMNPFSLRDADSEAIAEAIESGRRRVAALTGPGDLEVVAAELSLDGARRRSLAWAFVHDRGRLESMVTLSELMVLGGARLDTLDAWGTSMLFTMGCLCSRLTPPGRWLTLFGRPQLGMTAAGMPDVHLQVAVRLRELRMPAALARVVLSAAVQDFIDAVRPSAEVDWITMTRAARGITREQIEDYLAAATAAGPLVPDNGPPY